MKTLWKHAGCAMFAVALLLSGTPAKAQDPPPQGGFKNAYLTLNKSGKVVLTYTLWDQQVTKGN